MAHWRYPLISKEDYQAMKALMWDLPASHEEFEYQIDKRRRVDAHEDKSWSGETLVPVNPQEFSAYCRKSNETPTRFVLDRFVNERRSDSD
jgi:hypothetical protein